MRITLPGVLVVALTFAMPLSSLPAATTWGLSGGCTIYATCQPYYCNGLGSRSGPNFNQDRGTNILTSVSAEFASAALMAELKEVGGAYFPEFQGTNSTANTGLYLAMANVVAIEGYHYTGATNKTFLFGGRLAGSSSAPRTQDGLRAELYFFRSTNFVYISHLPTLLYETDAQVITNCSFKVAVTNNNALLSNVVAVTAAPGETFFLYASLQLSVFAQGAQCGTLTPYQVFCLNPDGLISESLRGDFPMLARTSGNDLQISWQATRRECRPESASTLDHPLWQAVTNFISADQDRNVLTVPITGGEQFFRLKIQ